MHRLRTALSILTILPVGATSAAGKAPSPRELPSPGELAASVPFFPVVGALLGAVLAIANHFLSHVLSGQVTAALLLAMAWLLSGGIHLDGLADTTDGLASRAPADRALEIMRDPRVGAVGAAATFLTILLKFSSLAALSAGFRTPVLFVMPVLGRQAMATVMPFYPYPRQVPGLASPFARRVPRRHAAAALGFTTLLLAATCLAYPQQVLPLAGAAVSALAGSWVAADRVARRLGGLTGDVYGAVCELAECIFLLTVCALA